MLDKDLAALYGVETKYLKRQVKRNLERFPEDFMFELNAEEFETLRRQIGTSSWGGSRYAPMAFTEQGIAQLSGVLNSPRAIAVNIQIIRLFTKMREVLSTHKELLLQLEGRVPEHHLGASAWHNQLIIMTIGTLQAWNADDDPALDG